MADERISATKKKSLPPLSPKGEGDEVSEPKPVKRKVKKKTARPDQSGTVDEGNVEGAEAKPRPRQRRKRSPSQAKDSEVDEAPTSPGKDGTTSPTGAPKKKKKKKPKPLTEETKDQGGDGGETTPKQESQGSKTSLLTKEGETPRKKGVKKKKKVKKVVTEEDEFGESPWADDLRTMKEDIITAGDKDVEEEEDGEDKEGSVYKKRDLKTTSVLVPSRPLDKIFVETSTKFKGLDRGILTKQMAEEEIKAATTIATPVVTRQTTIDFALASHRLFRVITLFLHGLTAGLCLWLLVTIFELTSFSKEDFLEHYYKTSLPLQCTLYFLLVVCTVSACDRFDVGNPTPRFILRSLTLQNGTVSIILYLVALILNLVVLRYEDKIYLYKEQEPDSTLATTPNPADFVKDSDIDTFKSLNTARCIFVMLSWLVLAITPNCDRLGKNLLSGETGLETELNMDKVSQA